MRQPARKPNQQRSELAEALSACRGAFIAVGLMSGMSNILMLTGVVLHAGGLRPRAAEPQRADAGRPRASSPPACSSRWACST